MLSAIISFLIGLALLIFVGSRYVNIKQLAPAKNLWISLEKKLNFAKKWWFKVLLVLIAIGAIGQITDQIEASKYEVDRGELSQLKASAAAKKIELADYVAAIKEAKAQNYLSVDEYLTAKKNGFSNSSDWENAKKLGVETFEKYEIAMQDMKVRGFTTVNEYIAQLQREAAERSASEKAAEEKKLATDPEYLYKEFHIKATFKCKKPIEDIAKNNFEWFDSWSESKFDSYMTKTPSPGVLILVGDKIKFQNGFGAWKIMKYTCAYDTVNDKVLNVNVFERN